MGVLRCSSLVQKAGILIQDATQIRWPEVELYDWLNDAQREIVLFKPEASVVNGSMTLVGGSTKQTIPGSGVSLLDIKRNLGADGLTPGRPIRIVSTSVLDSQAPDWHTNPNTLGYVQHYTFDPRDPLHYYVYPKAPATWSVEGIYSVSPADCGIYVAMTVAGGKSYSVAPSVTFSGGGGTGAAAKVLLTAGSTGLISGIEMISMGYGYTSAPTVAISGGTSTGTVDPTLVVASNPTLSIADVYANAVLDYVLYRCYSKDATFAQNAQLATAHYQLFMASLNGKGQVDALENPNLLGGAVGNPNVVTVKG